MELAKGTKVIVSPTAPWNKDSYPAANWIWGAVTVTLNEYAPNTGSLDVIDVTLPNGTVESIYDFNILRVA